MAIYRAAVAVLCVVLAASTGSAQRRELRGPYEVVSYGADGLEGGDGPDTDVASWHFEDEKNP